MARRWIRYRPVLWVACALVAAACASMRRTPAESASTPAVSSARGPRSVPIRDRFARARLLLLRAINADRAAAGLDSVSLDSLATVAAQGHAEAMADGGFYSHYDLTGRAPYERLAALGSTAHVLENVARRRERDEDPLLVDDPWRRFEVKEAHTALMESAPHRAVILDPHRTGVGLGFAVDSAGRAVFVVEDFVARHAAMTAPGMAPSGRPARIAGRVLDPDLQPLAILLRREPPARPWPDSEPPGGSYDDGGSDPQIVGPWEFTVLPDGTFVTEVGGGLPPGRYYGILYVAPAREVEIAMERRRATMGQGWPAAAFVFEVAS